MARMEIISGVERRRRIVPAGIPRPKRATVGGLACGVSSSRRLKLNAS